MIIYRIAEQNNKSYHTLFVFCKNADVSNLQPLRPLKALFPMLSEEKAKAVNCKNSAVPDFLEDKKPLNSCSLLFFALSVFSRTKIL